MQSSKLPQIKQAATGNGAVFLRPIQRPNRLSHCHAGFPGADRPHLQEPAAAKYGVLADGVEKTIHGRRQGHLTAIILPQLEKLGLYAAPDIQP
ncbi:hypothetical protein [Chromobacterium sp. Panama]|uniref:hypothetical protein n=1 Tax=Chromobacterium sp. Panama TaxID=2161826 RepID=UPI0011B2820F|nr:hypothetical protein [Chromobacterium sp. Panama]